MTKLTKVIKDGLETISAPRYVYTPRPNPGNHYSKLVESNTKGKKKFVETSIPRMCENPKTFGN